jgi:rod shape-determining protein MreC
MKTKLNRELVLFLLLLFLCGFLFWADKNGWLKSIRGSLEKPILLMEGRLYLLKVNLSPWLKNAEREKELNELKAERIQNLEEQNQLSVCLEENEKMRRLLGAPLPAKWKFIPARVVGISSLIRLDKGEKDGLKIGMNIVDQNLLVGKVVSVEQNSALGQTPLSPGVKIPVLVRRYSETASGIQARGLLSSLDGENLVLDRVLQSEDIQKGDLVATLGEDGWLADLLLGEVVEILPKSAEIYQKAKVKSLLDYQNLRTVFLVNQ